ncbi:phage portal protein [Streptomyces sp. A1-5]|uniref:phage portal protein n=1 Tax=Streptomyces sp. A1-5 TaxID=2738410 RepID=UPI001F3E96F6|nr:phage portal protein [Streptomyces sp. A1-5]UJB43596.1 phage portal protein [Streptomyces sp. A1-5]
MDTRDLLSVGLAQRKREMPELVRVDQYMRGVQDAPYMPKRAEAEFRKLVARSVENWLPLIVSVIAQNLRVEGYRSADNPDDLEAWRYWSANQLDARQNAVHRAALTFGRGYVAVTPGDEGPAIRPVSPLSVTGVAADPDAEWLDGAVRFLGRTKRDGKSFERWQVWDDYAITDVLTPDGEHERADKWITGSPEPHGLSRCPIVAFRNRWGDAPNTLPHELGEVAPLIPIQDRLNETTLNAKIAESYSAFRQRWASGISIPRDPKTGQPVETFRAAVDRLWMVENKDVRFGEFEQTDLSGYLASREAAIKSMSAIAQVPPHFLLGGMVNISADALTAAESGLSRRVHERQMMFGEAWEQTLRLAAEADGRDAAAGDTSARIIWHDAEARSLSATVDALGKLSQLLGVPAEALWERVPGVTAFDVQAWRRAKTQDATANLAAQLLMGQHTSEATPEDGGPVGRE